MIYTLLKQLFRWAFKVYFRKINIQWAEPMAKNRPTVFVANHPSALMDGLLIAGLVDQELHFMSRGESFDKPFKRWLFAQFHMHPIYRQEFTPQLTHLNPQQMGAFQQMLIQGNNLLIFPEGLSKTELRLRKVKSGAARVVLGAMAATDYELDVQLIPIGLNYSDPHRFRSEVSICFGKPISLDNYVALNQVQPRKAVQALTSEIAAAIGALTVEVEEKQLDELVLSLDQLCEQELRRPTSRERRQEVARAVNYFSRFRPDVLCRLRPLIHDYRKRLKGFQLDDHRLLQLAASSGTRLLSLLPALPLFLYSYLNSWPTLKLSRWLAQRLTRRPDFYGSLLLAFGVLCTVLFLGVQLGLVYWLTASSAATLLYALSLPLACWLGLRYYSDFRMLWQWGQLCLGPTASWRQLAGLLEEREHLLRELRQCWQLYHHWRQEQGERR
ncbi:MAG: 1-acyl-sn-glycerol-3-phosphate acyltransferase [Bacteroidota bacterium]